MLDADPRAAYLGASVTTMDSDPPSEPSPSSRAWARLGLALLLVVAAWLRLSGLEHGLPQTTEPDGLVFAAQTELIRSGAEHPERELLWGFYPQLVARLASLLPAPAVPPESEPLARLAAAAHDFFAPRLVVALLSLLSVPASFALARRFLAPGWSLAVSALVASSTLTLWFAQQARPHAAAAALALVALVAALRVAEEGRWIDVLLAGVAAALALGALQFGVFVLPPILLAILLVRERGWAWRVAAALVVLAHAALGVLAFYPFLFAEGTPGGSHGVAGGELELSGHRIYLELFNGAGLSELIESFSAYDPWIALASLAGGCVLAARWLRGARADRERRRALAIVLAYALPFALALALYQRTYQRFAIPLVPFLALAAVAGAACLARTRPRLALLAGLALVLPQLGLGARLATLRARPDTVAEASRWIETHLMPGVERVLFLPTFELPLPGDAASLEANARMLDTRGRPWWRWQDALPAAQRAAAGWTLYAMPLQPSAQKLLAADPVRYLDALAADWFVVEVYREQRKPLLLDPIHPALPAVATRVARFAPEAPDFGDDLPLSWADDEYPRKECWALRLLCAERLGPVLEIWRAGPSR